MTQAESSSVRCQVCGLSFNIRETKYVTIIFQGGNARTVRLCEGCFQAIREIFA